MSFTYTSYLIIGIKTTAEELSINVWDDQWLPYTEGWSNTEIRFITGESNTSLYIGKVLAKWSKGDDIDYSVEYIPEVSDLMLVSNFVQDQFQWTKETPRLRFLVICN